MKEKGKLPEMREKGVQICSKSLTLTEESLLSPCQEKNQDVLGG